VWNAHNTVFGSSARLAVHKLFTSCIRRGQVSYDSIVDGDWLPATERCQRNAVLSTRVGRRRKFGEVSCT